jgi:competence protein ComEA
MPAGRLRRPASHSSVEVLVNLTRRQLLAYVALGVVVLALGVRYVVVPRTARDPAGAPLVLAPAVAASPSASAAPDLMVYVCGAVRRPGVVRLPAGARVCDALDLAGGPTARAELAAVNLAARLADGQQVVVPERAAAGATPAATGAAAAGPAAAGMAAVTGASSGALININTASPVELETLDGVGPATAQKIVDYRTERGGFTSIDEIKNVPGIGDAKFEAMKDSITV